MFGQQYRAPVKQRYYPQNNYVSVIFFMINEVSICFVFSIYLGEFLTIADGVCMLSNFLIKTDFSDYINKGMNKMNTYKTSKVYFRSFSKAYFGELSIHLSFTSIQQFL